MKELNKENFKEFVKGKAIVDFWAEWCVDPHSTEILIGENGLKKAKDVLEMDNLVTFDGKRLVLDSVEKSFTSNMLGHCREIVTESERSIKVTDEHEFYTKGGWKKAIELSKEDEVAVMPVYVCNKGVIKESKEIVNEENIKKVAVERMLIEKYIEELKEKKLLPLKGDNEKMLVVSRLLGILFTDGNLYLGKKNNYREITFSLGVDKDVEEVVNDLKNLGYNKVHITKQRKRINVNNRSYTINVIRVKLCSTSLWLFFKALGAPVGDKTSKEYSLPKWLMEADISLKREFLSAFMGGDGPKIAIRLSKRKDKESYNTVSLNDIEFHKNPEVEGSGVKMARELSELFTELGVETSKVFVKEDSYLKKDGKKSKVIHIKFKNNFENVYNLYRNVGYRYSHTKEMNSRYASEFLRRILFKRQKWLEVYQKVVELDKRGDNYKDISKKLNLSENTVWNWVKYGVKPAVKKHYMKFPSWLEENRENLVDGLMWEPIKKVKEVYLESVQKIRMKKNHNFIANDFLVHNCGPCRMLGPIFEEVSEEIKDVSFGKVNADEGAELAAEYGVQGIPCIILFKDGEEVDRIVGFVSKEELKNKIEEIF